MESDPFKKSVAALLLLSGVFLCGLLPAKGQEAPKRPNILIIAVDDLNDWEGFLGGHPQAYTPHMDRLARRGTAFTNAHCQAPLCNPSRTSFLTGLRPSTTGAYALDPWFRQSEKFRDWETLPQYFAKHGYRTLTTGKIFHDAYPPAPERETGKEFTLWGFHGTFGPRPAQKFVQTPDPHPLVDWGVFPERDEDQDDWKVADWAIAQLKKPQPGPFMLSVGLRRPHVPCYASQKWFDRFPEKDVILPPVLEGDRNDTPRFSWYLHWKLPEPRLEWLKRTNQWRPLVRAYLASTSFVDSQVGRVLQALRESDAAENTVVVLLSDHGWHLGEKGVTGKNTLWERSTRVPLIIAGPGVAQNARTDCPAELLDIYPTLAEIAGLPSKEGLNGHSLVPQLRDAMAPREWPAITTQGPGNTSIRTERWRYIRYADGSQELYDRQSDPNEWHNIAARPERRGAVRELAKWLPSSYAPPITGSKTRLIEVRDGTPYWEGNPIKKDDPVPMDRTSAETLRRSSD